MPPKVIVVDYDPSWPDTFARLRANIWPSICDAATVIEHVGSTSVPGLAAKPIIDMTIIVPNAGAMRTVIHRLAILGYHHRGDLGVPGRQAFSNPPATPPHHLYACLPDNDALHNHLAIRDYLRSNPSAAEAYAQLKKQLATQFPDDIDAYIDGKTEFILTILSRSSFSPAQIAQIRDINSKA
ncbi:MAG TPA: GrpB family protein [Tepidisphaeraceae bacterium]|nr:GrpB family protein [Tepidisphaeraceae bacterium]